MLFFMGSILKFSKSIGGCNDDPGRYYFIHDGSDETQKLKEANILREPSNGTISD
jgi:hypothetical protein